MQPNPRFFSSLKKRRKGLLFGLLALVFSGCTPIINQSLPSFSEVTLQGEGKDKMLLIDIDGIIANQPILVPEVGLLPGMTARVRQELELAFDDPNLRGILLRINSNGGTLTDSDILYHTLMEFKKSKKVKIVASFGEVAASGAVYLAMAADEIYAHPTTITGSIGVIIQKMDFSELFRRMGIKSDPISSGAYKDMESEFRPRSKEEKAMMQKLIQSYHKRFVSIIQENRKAMKPEALKKLSDGRLLGAEEAKAKGLIDEVGYLDDAYRRLGDLSGFSKNRLVRYTNVWSTGNNIYTNTFPIEFNR